MLSKLSEEYNEWRLKVNIDKTKYECVRAVTDNLQLGNKEVSMHKEYKYLGIIFTDVRTDDRKLNVANKKDNILLEHYAVGQRN